MSKRVGDLPVERVPVSAYQVTPEQTVAAIAVARRFSKDLDEYQLFIDALGLGVDDDAAEGDA